MTEMNDDQQGQSEEAMEALFRHASRRLRPPITDEKEIREAVHAQWLRMNRRRRRGRQTLYWAIAASLVLAGFLSVNISKTPVTYPTVAVIEKSIGEIALRQDAAADMARLRSNIRSFSSGQTVATGVDSALALGWSAGGSLRLDQETELIFISPTEVELLAGRIYFDSGSVAGPNTDESSLIVKTQVGVVKHVGTQFMTDLLDDSLTVSVREGVVSISGKGYTGTAMAGQQVILRADGAHSQEMRSTYGGEWQWVQSIAPPLDVDGLNVLTLLNWVSRESGRPLRFESASAREIASVHVLNGPVEVEPIRALGIYLQTTDLRSELVDDVISIRLTSVGD